METYTIKEFMNKDFKEEKRIKRQVKMTIVSGCAVGAIYYFTGGTVFAADGLNGIDQGARMIYGKLLLIGKWIIIIKGGIDTVNSTVQGDFATAKKSFLSYLMIYMVLQGMPWAMDQVDYVFNNMEL